MIVVDPNKPKEEGVIRVTIAIPNMGYTAPESYCNRLINFMHLGHLEQRGKDLKESPRFEFNFAVVGRVLTPLAREECAKMTLEWNSDYLLMIDDDMLCPDDLFERLWKHNVDIIAPLAFTRSYPHKPVMYSSLEGYDPVQKKDYFLNHYVMNYPKDRLVECDAVGFGAALIKRWVLEKMDTPRFMSTCGTGEDILFCYKAKKVGAHVFMDTSTKIDHLGSPLVINEEYVQSLRKTDPMFEKHHAAPYTKYAAKQQNGCHPEALFIGEGRPQ